MHKNVAATTMGIAWLKTDFGLPVGAQVLQLRATDVQPQAVRLHGKGRKQRTTPLWPPTAQRLRRWLKTNQVLGDQFISTNRRGDPLTRDGAAYRLARTVAMAAKGCPSLRGRRITPHTFRHTAAMHLLQSGVALELIALWLGHEPPVTTHGYIEANLKMKQQCMRSRSF